MSPIVMKLQCRQDHTAVKILSLIVSGVSQAFLGRKVQEDSDISYHGRSLDRLSVCTCCIHLLVNAGFFKNSCKHNKLCQVYSCESR